MASHKKACAGVVALLGLSLSAKTLLLSRTAAMVSLETGQHCRRDSDGRGGVIAVNESSRLATRHYRRATRETQLVSVVRNSGLTAARKGRPPTV